MSVPGTRSYTAIALDLGKVVVGQLLREAIRHPEFQQVVQTGQVMPTEPVFAPLQGCPWCHVAKAMGGAHTFLDRAVYWAEPERAIALPERTTKVNFYLHQTKVTLNGILGSLAITPGPVQKMHRAINDLQASLVGYNLQALDLARLAELRDRCGAVMDAAIEGGEGVDPEPTLYPLPGAETMPYRAPIPAQVAGEQNGSRITAGREEG